MPRTRIGTPLAVLARGLLQRSAFFLLSRDFTFLIFFSIFSIHFFRQHLKDYSVGFREAA